MFRLGDGVIILLTGTLGRHGIGIHIMDIIIIIIIVTMVIITIVIIIVVHWYVHLIITAGASQSLIIQEVNQDTLEKLILILKQEKQEMIYIKKIKWQAIEIRRCK